MVRIASNLLRIASKFIPDCVKIYSGLRHNMFRIASKKIPDCVKKNFRIMSKFIPDCAKIYSGLRQKNPYYVTI
jgi:mannose/fructose/N-acetylgalactosamine-specific phosphotransferase system component IIC